MYFFFNSLRGGGGKGVADFLIGYCESVGGYSCVMGLRFMDPSNISAQEICQILSWESCSCYPYETSFDHQR